MQKALILVGAAIVIIGLTWPWISRLPLGRLPGDIVINHPSFKIFIPITTMVLISIVLSLIFWILRK
jgi:hypothetical protein